MPSPESPRTPLPLVRAACLALPVLWAPALTPAHAGPPSGQTIAGAADTNAPTVPLVHVPLAPQPPLPAAEMPPGHWREAHEAVGMFPRGHADILAWERRQVPPPEPHSRHGAGGGRP